jgi:hypothetical protein
VIADAGTAPASGSSGTHAVTGAARATAPASTCCITAAAVSCLVIEPMRNTVPGPTAPPFFRCLTPYPFS